MLVAIVGFFMFLSIAPGPGSVRLAMSALPDGRLDKLVVSRDALR